jgi:sortase (surface protein transpeptidase)
MPAENDKPAGRHISHIRVVRRPVAAAILACGILAVGAGVTGLAVASQTGRVATPVGKPTFAPISVGKQAPVPLPSVRRVAGPVALVIPVIGVSTTLIHLGLTATGALQVPSSPSVAGWYSAVIAGHIDSVSGPGVFFRLRLLRRGSRVYVRRANGSVAVFEVTAVHNYLKSRFPTVAVYGPEPDAQLRLITCGGTFDYATGHYLSNVIVFATLVQ